MEKLIVCIHFINWANVKLCCNLSLGKTKEESMVRVVFKNLEKSEIIKKVVEEKLSHTIEKFPELDQAHATATVSMENSQFQAGRDVFHVRIILLSKRLRPIILEKTADNPYLAASVLSDRLFEVLHRSIERKRDQLRSARRKWKGSPHVEHEWRSAG